MWALCYHETDGENQHPPRDQRTQDAGPHPPSVSRRTRGSSSVRQIIFVLAGRHPWGHVWGLLTWNMARGSSSPRPAGPSLNRGVPVLRLFSLAPGEGPSCLCQLLGAPRISGLMAASPQPLPGLHGPPPRSVSSLIRAPVIGFRATLVTQDDLISRPLA